MLTRTSAPRFLPSLSLPPELWFLVRVCQKPDCWDICFVFAFNVCCEPLS